MRYSRCSGRTRSPDGEGICLYLAKGKRGQAYNLNLAGSDPLAPDGRGNWLISPKCDTSPNSNRAFWDRKPADNVARDKRVTRQLRGRGWKVIRLWHHSLKKSPNACLNRIRRALESAY